MVKHTYFSIKLSILKHPVVIVVKKRRKELNYGQELAFQSKQITTTETSRIGHQDRWIKSKNYYILRHTGAHQVMTKTSSHNRHFGTRIQGIGTNYTHLCLVQQLLSQMQSTRLQEELAAYPVERKQLPHLYCRDKL